MFHFVALETLGLPLPPPTKLEWQHSAFAFLFTLSQSAAFVALSRLFSSDVLGSASVAVRPVRLELASRPLSGDSEAGI